MSAQACKKCKRLFNSVFDKEICPDCEKEEEEKFKKIKDYLRGHKNASLNDVSKYCKVEVNQLKRWLKEGRIELASGSSINLVCENCGKPITKGRYCAKCVVITRAQFNNIITEKKNEQREENRKKRLQSKSPKMRYL